MRVLVVSDTHRYNDNYFKVVEQENPDVIIHCGDAEGSEYALTQAADCPVHIILGNNDFFSELPRELTLEVEGKKIWVTHGHNYFVSMSLERLIEEARSRELDIVCFGHIHRPVIHNAGNLLILNPGSLSFPRQEGRRPSYAILNLEEGKEVTAEIKYL